jgi:hypothetical protein
MILVNDVLFSERRPGHKHENQKLPVPANAIESDAARDGKHPEAFFVLTELSTPLACLVTSTPNVPKLSQLG